MSMNGSFGMFGLPKRPIGTGGVFNGQFDDEPMAQQQQQMQPQNKRWLDGGKFSWKDGLALALGAIGDARTGRPMTSQLILGSYQQRKQAEERQKLMEQQRQAGREDKMWEWQNKPVAPPKPPAIQQNADYIRATRGDEAADAYLDNYGRGETQPNVVSIPGLGTFYGTPEQVAAGIEAARGGGTNPIEAEMRRRGLM